MKPGPYLVQKALNEIDASLGRAVLIGDSPSDVHAAKAARISAIGYANKPGKAERLALAGADAVIESVRELLPALDNAPLP